MKWTMYSDSDSTIIDDVAGDKLIGKDVEIDQTNTNMDKSDESDEAGRVCDELPIAEVEDDVLQESMAVAPVKKLDNVNNNNDLELIKKVYRKRVSPSGEEQYYLSWRNYPAKKHRCWVNRSDLSPQLKEYVDSKKIPCLTNK